MFGFVCGGGVRQPLRRHGRVREPPPRDHGPGPVRGNREIDLDRHGPLADLPERRGGEVKRRMDAIVSRIMSF